MYRHIRWEHFPKWLLFINRKICVYILNKNSEDDTLNPVLCASPYVELFGQTTPSFQPRTHDPPGLKPDWHRFIKHIVSIRLVFATVALALFLWRSEPWFCLQETLFLAYPSASRSQKDQCKSVAGTWSSQESGTKLNILKWKFLYVPMCICAYR